MESVLKILIDSSTLTILGQSLHFQPLECSVEIFQRQTLSINSCLSEVDVFGAQSVEYPTELCKSRQITCPTILTLNSFSVSFLSSPRLSVIAWLFLCQLFSPLLTHSGLFCPPQCYSFCSLWQTADREAGTRTVVWVLMGLPDKALSDSWSKKARLLTFLGCMGSLRRLDESNTRGKMSGCSLCSMHVTFACAALGFGRKIVYRFYSASGKQNKRWKIRYLCSNTITAET